MSHKPVKIRCVEHHPTRLFPPPGGCHEQFGILAHSVSLICCAADAPGGVHQPSRLDIETLLEQDAERTRGEGFHGVTHYQESHTSQNVYAKLNRYPDSCIHKARHGAGTPPCSCKSSLQRRHAWKSITRTGRVPSSCIP